jgi:putative restriction endonuclease
LIQAAESRVRPYRVRETSDSDGYYVRHALFPKVVKDLYNEACAICGLNARTEVRGGVVDAAHIMPFAEFHNDDPRNGIALCKNHHWGFDCGWFAISDDYKTVVSPQLQNRLPYITPGVTLLLPSQIQYAPATDALRWHRSHKFLR